MELMRRLEYRMLANIGRPTGRGCLQLLTLERLLSSVVLLLATHCGQLRRGETSGSHTQSLEATFCCQGAPRRTSEAAMMRLYHNVLPFLMSSFVLIQIQFASSALLTREVDFWEPHSPTRDHMSSFRSSKKDL